MTSPPASYRHADLAAGGSMAGTRVSIWWSRCATRPAGISGCGTLSSPREVWALHSLFHSAGIQIRFRPGHHFLVAVDQTGKVLGGLGVPSTTPGVVHMEKIVVAPSHRRRAFRRADGDFFRRMRERGMRGRHHRFFRPQYFRRFRFQIAASTRGWCGSGRGGERAGDGEEGGLRSRRRGPVRRPGCRSAHGLNPVTGRRALRPPARARHPSFEEVPGSSGRSRSSELSPTPAITRARD